LQISSPQLTAAAGNYAYVNLRFGLIDVAVAPGGRHHRRSLFMLISLHSYALGTLAPLGQAFKFSFFSAWIADGCHCSATVGARRRPARPASMPMACLYAYGLLFIFIINVIIIIVIIHPLFKWNVYLSL
jgi:hypothetical protein